MKIAFFFLTLFSIASCSSFYEFKNNTVESEMHRVFKMDLGNEEIDFKAYNDYYFDTINLSVVYVSKKELNQIKRSTVPKRNNKQILFLHNISPYYVNIIGFYYSDLYLSEIREPKFEFSTQKLANGFVYNYNFRGKPVSDFYVPFSRGILRFVAVGNPQWYEKNQDSFWKEIDYVFYVLNPELFKFKMNKI